MYLCWAAAAVEQWAPRLASGSSLGTLLCTGQARCVFNTGRDFNLWLMQSKVGHSGVTEMCNFSQVIPVQLLKLSCITVLVLSM